MTPDEISEIIFEHDRCGWQEAGGSILMSCGEEGPDLYPNASFRQSHVAEMIALAVNDDD